MSNSTKPQWNSSLVFILAMIGSAVGLGNIWRFPYVLYSNGGGSFLIPYIIAIAVVGFSFVLLEYSVGYKFKKSLYLIYKKIRPKLEIFAWFLLVLIFLVLTYYVTIVGWDLVYLVLSFFKGWGADPVNFFSNSLLQSTDSITGITHIVIIPCVATIAIWLSIWFISHRNLNDGIGKFSKIAIPLLFFLVCVIVFFSLTLPGASIGLTQMFKPDWSSLFNPNIWIAACGQIIFSLSLGMGIAITYTSYLKKGANLTKSASIVVLSNSGFEVFNAIGIFAILGFMSLSSSIPVNDLIVDGTGLAFVAFPEVFNVMGNFAYIIGPIFFLCILIAGITSAFALVEPISFSLSSKFGFSRKKSVTIISVLGILVSLLFTTGAGSYILGIFDTFLNNFALLLGIAIEAIIFTWLYSVDELVDTLNQVTSFKVGKVWRTLIKYILPCLLIILWIVNVVGVLQSTDSIQLYIFGILVVVLLVVPYLLYRAKGKNNNKNIVEN